MESLSILDDFLEVTDALLLAPDGQTLISAFETALKPRGMTGFLVCGFPERGSAFRRYHCDATLAGWLAAYESEHLQPDCPMTAHLLSSPAPATVETVFARVVAGSKAAAVVGIAQEHGVRQGLLVPIHTRSGDKGAVGLATEDNIADPRQQALLHVLALTFHTRFEELYAPVPAAGMALSAREADVLRWLAEGKSAEDVGDILHINSGTVMFHYRRVAERLGTTNRTHTVVEAIRRGLMGSRRR